MTGGLKGARGARVVASSLGPSMMDRSGGVRLASLRSFRWGRGRTSRQAACRAMSQGPDGTSLPRYSCTSLL
jgi:hypothetical protein